MMNHQQAAVDSVIFKQTVAFLKQTNELTELFLNITPTEYKPELNIAKDILLHQNFQIAKTINELTAQSKEVPLIYKELFKTNQTLIRLILIVPPPKNYSEVHKTKKTPLPLIFTNGN